MATLVATTWHNAGVNSRVNGGGRSTNLGWVRRGKHWHGHKWKKFQVPIVWSGIHYETFSL